MRGWRPADGIGGIRDRVRGFRPRGPLCARGPGPLRAAVELAALYDELGFRTYHVAEHHGTPFGLAPSPGMLLTAVAARTERLRIGPLVYLLPLYHPLRVYEEICMLDQLSGGRFELGIGRGISPYELGISTASTSTKRRTAIANRSRFCCRPFANDTLTYDGKYHQFKDVPLPLKPLQQPHPPLWYGALRPDTARLGRTKRRQPRLRQWPASGDPRDHGSLSRRLALARAQARHRTNARHAAATRRGTE